MGRVAMLALVVAAAAAGCNPLSPTAPFHFGETPDALARGRVAVGAAAGAGKLQDIGGGVGAAGRVRYGVGGGHEVRAEAAVIGRINDDTPTDERPWLGKSSAWLYKAGWKWAWRPWLAVMAGAGGSHSETGNALGGDAALELSTSQAYFGGRVRPYFGLRGLFAVPVGRDRDEAGGPTRALVGAAGAAFDTSSVTQLFVEFGALGEWNRGYFSTDADPTRTIQSQHKAGAYLAIGATFFLGGRTRAAPK
jgi:hypothetical protein